MSKIHMAAVYVVRHTEYENPDNIYHGRLPLPLSRLGKKKAKSIGIWFKKNKLHLPIISSPVKRTLQTANIIAKEIDSSVEIDNRLIEVWTELEGKPMVKNQTWEEIYKRKREPLSSIANRSISILEDSLSSAGGKILVTHGDSATLLYYYSRGKKLNTKMWLQDDYIPKGGILKINNIDYKLSTEIIDLFQR